MMIKLLDVITDGFSLLACFLQKEACTKG